MEFDDIKIDVVNFVDVIGMAEELFSQLVTSFEKHFIDMYLEQTQSAKLSETETWLQSKIICLITLK